MNRKPNRNVPIAALCFFALAGLAAAQNAKPQNKPETKRPGPNVQRAAGATKQFFKRFDKQVAFFLKKLGVKPPKPAP